MTYYAQRKIVKDGQAQANVTNKIGSYAEMERQYHLFCANACSDQGDNNDLDAIEWGTFEQGVIERKVYYKAVEPEPEPEEPENSEELTEPEETDGV